MLIKQSLQSAYLQCVKLLADVGHLRLKGLSVPLWRPCRVNQRPCQLLNTIPLHPPAFIVIAKKKKECNNSTYSVKLSSSRKFFTFGRSQTNIRMFGNCELNQKFQVNFYSRDVSFRHTRCISPHQNHPAQNQHT